MITIGGDSHKRTHTFVAVDEVGRKVAETTVAATTEGHLEALEWAAKWPERTWALEDCRHLTRRLESDLLRAGEAVMRVPPRLMAGERRGAREVGKSDPIDAMSVARAALREPDLPVARLDGETRQVKLLVDHRDDLVAERTRMQSRLRWHLHELMPEHVITRSALKRTVVLDDLDRRLRLLEGPVAKIAVELVGRIRELTRRANELEREITVLVRRLAPSLLELPGCGVLSTAKIVAETAGVDRFRSNAAYAVERDRTDPGVDRKPTIPAEPWRQPPSQRSGASHRDHPMARRRPRPRLHAATHPTRRHQDQRHPSAPPAPVR